MLLWLWNYLWCCQFYSAVFYALECQCMVEFYSGHLYNVCRRLIMWNYMWCCQFYSAVFYALECQCMVEFYSGHLYNVCRRLIMWNYLWCFQFNLAVFSSLKCQCMAVFYSAILYSKQSVVTRWLQTIWFINVYVRSNPLLLNGCKLSVQLTFSYVKEKSNFSYIEM